MTITDEAPLGAAVRINRSIRRVRIIAWALALGWLCLLVTVVATSERPGSYAALADGLRTGEISAVERSLAMIPNDGQGYESVRIRWRDGFILRTATLTHATDERMAKEARQESSPRPVVVGSVDEHLRALSPEVKIRNHANFATGSLFGWQVPGWISLAYFVLLVGTLGLIAGPRPWRATRWAWGWLVLLAPYVGVPAYFLFGGPLGLFRPRPPIRVGLTGGWAFLLALLLGGSASS